MVVWPIFFAEFPLLLFHLSVFSCILNDLRITKTGPFSTSFFKLYLLRSIADYSAFFTGTLIQRLRHDCILPHEIHWIPQILLNFTLVYALYFQLLSCSVVAANRYTALVHPLRHQALWRNEVFARVLLAMLATSVFCAVVFMAASYFHNYKDTENPYLKVVILLDSFGMNVMTLAICAALEFRTLYVYHRLDHNLKRQYRDDYMLLMHAATNIAVPILLASFILIDTTTPDDDPLNVFADYALPYVVDVLSLTEPLWLMLFR